MNLRIYVVAWALLASSLAARSDILAQSGYQEGQDGVLLMTEKCPADATGELRVAVRRNAGRVLEGCYVLNNRGNAVVKWSTGEIRELEWTMFGNKPLGTVAVPKGSGGYSDWEFFSNKTTKGTPVCGVFSASTDKSNVRNVSVKSLANRQVISVTLFNDRWNFNANPKLPVVLDFADNQPLRVEAYAEGKVVDIEVPVQLTATFLSLMSDNKVIQFKVGPGNPAVWGVPLRNIKAPMKQFIDCAQTRNAQ
jgi:hypothetical protein